ncbi:MAG TPA: hypothetical protein VNS22_21040, partial [Geminicoccus sp.]
IIGLGGGRTRPDQAIDHAVGLSDVLEVGEATGPDRPLLMVHARDEAAAEAAMARLRPAFEVGPEPAAPPPLVTGRIV